MRRSNAHRAGPGGAPHPSARGPLSHLAAIPPKLAQSPGHLWGTAASQVLLGRGSCDCFSCVRSRPSGLLSPPFLGDPEQPWPPQHCLSSPCPHPAHQLRSHVCVVESSRETCSLISSHLFAELSLESCFLQTLHLLNSNFFPCIFGAIISPPRQ